VIWSIFDTGHKLWKASTGAQYRTLSHNRTCAIDYAAFVPCLPARIDHSDITTALCLPPPSLGPSLFRTPRRHVEPAPLQFEQEITSVLRALEGPIDEADQFLAAVRRRAGQHQEALLFVCEACLEMVPSAQI
jgi:hypothetical protein